MNQSNFVKKYKKHSFSVFYVETVIRYVKKGKSRIERKSKDLKLEDLSYVLKISSYVVSNGTGFGAGTDFH